MTKQGFLGAVCACALSVLALPASAVTINYSNTAGGQVNLDPTDGCGGGAVGCFGFSSGSNLVVTSGSATGFTGSISGIFGVGAISSPVAGFETASVNGVGTLTIFDGVTLY